MFDMAITRIYDFDVTDDLIHEFASSILLIKEKSEFVLTQGEYAYRVKGGGDGYLYYKKGANQEWVLIANWCFYGLYIVIRYRKPLWLRPMYQSLFRQMNFVSILFGEHSIEAVTTSGEIIRSRRFRLSPPSALSKVMTEKFGYSQEKIEALRAELNL
jgi:hypothetical protein